jgi:hypothetical protein
LLAAALFPVLSVECHDDLVGDGVVPCAPSAPIFLHSKLDDDDGDGNPRDERYPIVNDEDDDIADHAWIRDRAGRYHLFFHTEGHAGGSDIEHYVSSDLRHLEYVGVALRRNPDGWDAAALWAPHVIESGGTYWMFYTGATAAVGPAAEQRIGVATSTDLVTWTRVPENRCAGTRGDGCVYECNEPWTAWGGAAEAYNRQCRDAFVLWDAAAARWVLFATAKSTNGFAVVSVAGSNDLTRWTGTGYIDATRRLPHGAGAQTTGGQAENPHVVERDGTYYLLFTDWMDPDDSCTVREPRTLVQYATSASLSADPAGSPQWAYRGSTPDPGVNAVEVQLLPNGIWLMSQSISNPSSCDEPEHRRELRLKRIVWGPGATFTTAAVSRPTCTECGPCGP